jgi:hypothetical protein
MGTTGDGSFLARWSRRKRGATPNSVEQSKPANATDGAAPESTPPSDIRPPFDPASLPPIGSIGAATDVRAFLTAGVPADLTLAALRRAWSSDLAIRDFVGLSENSWDFNAPDGVPGFGSVKAEDLRQLLAQVIGEPEAADDRSPPAAEVSSASQAMVRANESGPSAKPAPQQLPARGSARDQLNPNHDTCADHHDLTRGSKENAATPHDPDERFPQSLRRGHGGALPKK